MPLASKYFDPVVGIDVHFEMVPSPAGVPVPTPFPNPFIGLVFDPLNLLLGQVIGAAVALATGGPLLGPVLINSLPANNVGTLAVNYLVLPHPIIPPGVSFTPMPKPPKPSIKGKVQKPGLPVAPEGDAMCVFGSRTVTVMGASAVRLGDLALSCSEPIRLPSSVVLAVPLGRPVLIGGAMSLSLVDAAMGLVRSKWVSGQLHAAISRFAPQRLRNFFHGAACFVTGHPVDVASGRVLTEQQDFALPGPRPLLFTRQYSSAWASRSGPLGYGWSHSLDQAVWPERGRLVYLDGAGRELEFDTFDFPDHVLPYDTPLFDPRTRLTLSSFGEGRYRVESADGVVREFAPVAGARGARQHWSRLCHERTLDGSGIDFSYDGAGNLASVRDAVGRVVGFEYDAAGRLLVIHLPHPSEPGWLPHTRYGYDAEGDLVEACDALGCSWKFRYTTHLLTQETNRNGLSFYFAYDGFGQDASCVRTWGDGGIYDHVLDYDKQKRVTCVTNSLGHTTMYSANAVGQVVEVLDPLGGATRYAYDEQTFAKTLETDPLGRETRWEYDARGNCVKTSYANGASIHVDYDERNRAVRAVDALGAESHAEYDSQGRQLTSTDALGAQSALGWQGPYVVSMLDAAGNATLIDYDATGNPARLVTPNGAENRFVYDARGRCHTMVDANGAIERRELDLCGRVVRRFEADGNVREFTYDPEGNVIAARDAQHGVRGEYRGFGRLTARVEGGARLEFDYDSEEQPIGVRDELGSVHRVVFDAAGRVGEEHGPDGSRRRYERDAAGQVTRVLDSRNRVTTYRYDAAGQIAEVRYPDGGYEKYEYRPDGLLVQATNESATLTYERDAAGRIVKETQGGDWLASEFDQLGFRCRLSSSRGFAQSEARDSMGDTFELVASLGAARSAVRFERDALGFELTRSLPGARSAWKRDPLGRPLEHQVWADGALLEAKRYAWEANHRLRLLLDAMHGPTEFSHDAWGRLAAASHADGRVDLRAPDAVGNLFRNPARDDRRYGAAGQLLEAHDSRGITLYEYDGEGRLTQRTDPDGSVWRCEWKEPGRLARVRRPDGALVEFTYDAFGRRISKRHRGQVTRWLWDGDVPLHEWSELEPPGSTGEESALISWVYDSAGFAPVARLEGGQVSYVLGDHAGAPMLLLNGAGEPACSLSLDSYGAVLRSEGAVQLCPLRFLGQFADEETGFYYNRHRYYDPASGIYLSPDPIGLYGGIGSLYSYVSDPNTRVDPMGTVDGGSHEDVRRTNSGGEVNHMPAFGAYAPGRGRARRRAHREGPAIWMTLEDHSYTASWKGWARAIRHRAAQKWLIARGNYIRAIEMDVRDVQSLFGHEYDRGIREMLAYCQSRGLVTAADVADLTRRCGL